MLLLLIVLPTFAQISSQRADLVRANYGSGNQWVDVTQRVRSLIQGEYLNFLVDSVTLGVNFQPGETRVLRLELRSQSGRIRQLTFQENEYVNLQVNAAEPSYANDNWGNLRIIRAYYGADNRSSDVTARLNSQIQSDRLNLKVSNDTMGGDPAIGRYKTLTVQYSYSGRQDQVVVNEGDTLILPTSNESTLSTLQTIRCESDNNARNYCPVDTRGGVRLIRQISGSACSQGSTWGYDSDTIWVDKGCRAEFEVLPVSYASTTSLSHMLRCESSNGGRNYCAADTRGGVRLTRQISGSACTQGSTWGYDSNQIWVDRGCRADFELLAVNYASTSPSVKTLRCESNDGGRNYCSADTRGGVRMTRQISGSACTQGSTWGYDSNQIWVDRGCRADFELTSVSYPSTTSVQTLRCESNDGGRSYCAADTRGGVRLTRQISGSACTQGSTWGYDSDRVWVDKGCRADFEVSPLVGVNAISVPYGTYITIPTGTELSIRTNEAIDSAKSKEGQQFSAVVNSDVRNSSGVLAIPKGSDILLIIRSTAGSDLVLDIDSVVVAGRRYTISTKDQEQKGREGIGANRRTAEMVGGGAALGAIIGAIAGGGKGAAIGAAVGAASGAGAQVLTKGKEVRIPSETILNFKLDADLILQPTSY